MNEELQRVAIAQYLYPHFPIYRSGIGELRHRYPQRGTEESGPALNYPQNADHAELLCDHMAEKGWNCELNQGTNGCWECIFFRKATESTRPENRGENPRFDPPDSEEHYHPADSIAGAISGAFLRAVGKWQDEPEKE